MMLKLTRIVRVSLDRVLDYCSLAIFLAMLAIAMTNWFTGLADWWLNRSLHIRVLAAIILPTVSLSTVAMIAMLASAVFGHPSPHRSKPDRP